MMTPSKIKEINDKISAVKELLMELETEADEFPALARNSKRALVSIKMLELNISDIVLLD